MSDGLFKIDLEVFCDRYKVDQKCMDEIALFLINHTYSNAIPEFYEPFISRQLNADALMNNLPHQDKWKENFKDGDTQREMIRQLYNYPDIVNEGTKVNWYYFPLYKDKNNFSNGVILNTALLLDWNNLRHKHLFTLLFANMFSQTKLPSEFLHYHFVNSFDCNKIQYCQFLTLVTGDHKDYVGTRIDFLKTWIADELTAKVIKTENKIQDEKKTISKLIDLFNDEAAFKNQIEILKKTEPPMIDNNGR
jgi:hypothetical protein